MQVRHKSVHRDKKLRPILDGLQYDILTQLDHQSIEEALRRHKYVHRNPAEADIRCPTIETSMCLKLL